MTETTTPEQGIPSRSAEELKQLALDIYAGRVYIDRYVQHPRDIPLVFMPLMFLDNEQLASLQQSQPGLIYEYLSEASPRTVNGMPGFFSMKTLNQADTEKLFDILVKLEEAITAV